MMSEEEPLKKAVKELLIQFDVTVEEMGPLEEEAKKQAEEYTPLIQSTQSTIDELNEKAEEFLQKSGMTREELEAYAHNPNNFTKEQWEALQKVREITDYYRRQIRVKLGDEVVKTAEKRTEKKQAHRFAKKKHWIPM